MPLSQKSKITSELVASFSALQNEFFVEENALYISENYAEGQSSIYKIIDVRKPEKLLTEEFSVRSRVNEYGGGSFIVCNGVLYFSRDEDQQVYRLLVGGTPTKISTLSHARYADFTLDTTKRFLVAVREELLADQESISTLVVIDLENSVEHVLKEGADFYSNPRFSSQGRHFCWLEHDHPNMPWDNNRLGIADFDPDNGLQNIRFLGEENESIFQPSWSPDNRLYFVSDRNNWWNIYRLNDDHIEGITNITAEFAFPQWIFGMSSYAFVGIERLVATYFQEGQSYIVSINTITRERQILGKFSSVEFIKTSKKSVFFYASSPDKSTELCEMNLNTGFVRSLFDRSRPLLPYVPFFSKPQSISFLSEGRKIPAFYYPPLIPDQKNSPPLLVKIHGGPTGCANSGLNLSTQFWTGQGFAVLDVNYRGSSGYGRNYRQQLYGYWGEREVQDCQNGVLYLQSKKLASDKVFLRGSSAGGYTALRALLCFDEFTAASVHYGLYNMTKMLKLGELYKFESRYLSRLLGSDFRDNCSPINTHRSRPAILFHGTDDRVVPTEQSEQMFHRLKKLGAESRFFLLEGEGHGFRRPENIEFCLNEELRFFRLFLEDGKI